MSGIRLWLTQKSEINCTNVVSCEERVIGADLMAEFIIDFCDGQPVVVMQEGRMIGIPCGFTLFDDGISWADDGVVQDYCSQYPYHHLYGEVVFADGTISCDGVTFAPGPLHDAKFGNAWASIGKTMWQWQQLHKMHINQLRLDRMARDPTWTK